MSTEKEVRRLPAGFFAYTSPNTWESVMISFGGRTRVSSAASSLSVVTLMIRHFLSRRSLMVCTCGRIRRPCGAWMSCGMTSSTRSPSDTMPPVMLRAFQFSGTRRARASRRASMPRPVAALIGTGATGFTPPPCMSSASATRAASSFRVSPFSAAGTVSALFRTMSAGVLFSTRRTSQFLSSARAAESSSSVRERSASSAMTTRAASVFFRASSVPRTRSSPMGPSSSKPAVSMRTQGPRP